MIISSKNISLISINFSKFLFISINFYLSLFISIYLYLSLFISKKFPLKSSIIVVLSLGLFLIVGAKTASAATCNWTNGAANNLWNDTGNWSCGHVPTQASSDSAVFDSANSNANVTINAAVDVTSWTMQNSYSGIITQGANSMTIRSGGWTQSTGTFTGNSDGSTANITIQSGGDFNLSDNSINEPIIKVKFQT